MKNKFYQKSFYATLTFLCLMFLTSCEEETVNSTSRVTFYVGNGGTAQRFTYITVKIGGLTENFLSPEGRDMTINDCKTYSNAAHINLPLGTYDYDATDGVKHWKGSVTLIKGECKILELNF